MPPKISVSNFYFGFGWIYLNWDIMKPSDQLQLVVKVFCSRRLRASQPGEAYLGRRMEMPLQSRRSSVIFLNLLQISDGLAV